VWVSPGTGLRIPRADAPASAALAPNLTVSLIVPDVPFKRGDTVAVSAFVLASGKPAAGASVTFTMTRANGSVATGTQTTNADGKAVWSYKLLAKDPRGTYSVRAATSYSGKQANAAPATFTVE